MLKHGCHMSYVVMLEENVYDAARYKTRLLNELFCCADDKDTYAYHASFLVSFVETETRKFWPKDAGQNPQIRFGQLQEGKDCEKIKVLVWLANASVDTDNPDPTLFSFTMHFKDRHLKLSSFKDAAVYTKVQLDSNKTAREVIERDHERLQKQCLSGRRTFSCVLEEAEAEYKTEKMMSAMALTELAKPGELDEA